MQNVNAENGASTVKQPKISGLLFLCEFILIFKDKV